MRIEDVLARRSDLSTFLVHLTRNGDDDADTARARLSSILQGWRIEARSPFGHAMSALTAAGQPLDSQKCVCFTETPLEHVSLLTSHIEGRNVHMQPYGVGLSKKRSRREGVNPVWYLDITPGHNWLTVPVDELIQEALNSPGGYASSPIARLTPFIEQMGSQAPAPNVQGYRKEFWWEREWRHVGHFILPDRLLVFCPEEDFPHFRNILEEHEEDDRKAKLLDPRWSLEKMIGRLAGFGPSADPF